MITYAAPKVAATLALMAREFEWAKPSNGELKAALLFSVDLSSEFQPVRTGGALTHDITRVKRVLHHLVTRPAPERAAVTHQVPFATALALARLSEGQSASAVVAQQMEHRLTPLINNGVVCRSGSSLLSCTEGDDGCVRLAKNADRATVCAGGN
jgi:hypothetical protein